MQVNEVPARAGVRWLREAFILFRAQPLAWISLTSAWMLSWMLLLLVPIIGQPVASMLQPVFFAGFVLACRDQQRGGAVTLAHLFVAFRVNGRSLVTLGALLLLVEQLVLLPFALTGTFDGFAQVRGMNANELMSGGLDKIVTGHEWALFGAFAAMIALEAIFWFTPALLAYRPMPVSHAVRWSLYALISNPAAMLVFASLTMMLFVIATLPWLLGLLIMLPVYAISHYTSFIAAFGEGPAPAEGTPPAR